MINTVSSCVTTTATKTTKPPRGKLCGEDDQKDNNDDPGEKKPLPRIDERPSKEVEHVAVDDATTNEACKHAAIDNVAPPLDPIAADAGRIDKDGAARREEGEVRSSAVSSNGSSRRSERDGAAVNSSSSADKQRGTSVDRDN